jgi:cytochrome c-type biogenesis protein
MNGARLLQKPSGSSNVRVIITAHSLAFVLGLSAVFVALGFSAGFVSNVLFDFGDALRVIAGAFLILMGLVMLRLLPLPFLQREARVHLARKPEGYLGSVLVGVAFAAGWTPCIGPILAGILAVASASGTASQGALLLGVYALGFAVPFLLAAQMLTFWRRLNRYTRLIEKVGGVLLILVGIVLLSNWISVLSPYLASLGSLETILLVGAEPSFFLAFAAGTLSFLSPCVLPILPSFLAYLTGMNAERLMAAREQTA